MSDAQKSKNHTKSPVLPLKSPSSSNRLYLTWCVEHHTYMGHQYVQRVKLAFSRQAVLHNIQRAAQHAVAHYSCHESPPPPLPKGERGAGKHSISSETEGCSPSCSRFSQESGLADRLFVCLGCSGATAAEVLLFSLPGPYVYMILRSFDIAEVSYSRGSTCGRESARPGRRSRKNWSLVARAAPYI